MAARKPAMMGTKPLPASASFSTSRSGTPSTSNAKRAGPSNLSTAAAGAPSTSNGGTKPPPPAQSQNLLDKDRKMVEYSVSTYVGEYRGGC